VNQEFSNYRLLVSTSCCCCDRVLNLIQEEQFSIQVINIDEEQNASLPFSLAILPALIKDEKLLSYGVEDIMKRLREA
jgi:hypothetical protein